MPPGTRENGKAKMEATPGCVDSSMYNSRSPYAAIPNTINSSQAQKPVAVKRGRGRPPVHKKDANGKVIIELDEHGNRIVPVQKYKPRGHKEIQESEKPQSTPAPRAKPKPQSAPTPTTKAPPISTPKPASESKAPKTARESQLSSTYANLTLSVNGISSEPGPGPATPQKRKTSDRIDLTWADVHHIVERERKKPRRGRTWPENPFSYYAGQEGRDIEKRRGEVNGMYGGENLDYDTDLDLVDEWFHPDIIESSPPLSQGSELDITDLAGDTTDDSSSSSQAEDDLYAAPTVPDKQHRNAPSEPPQSTGERMLIGDPSTGCSFVERKWVYNKPSAYRLGETGMFEERNLTVLSLEPFAPWHPDEEEIPRNLVLGEDQGLLQSQEMKDFMFEYGLEEH